MQFKKGFLICPGKIFCRHIKWKALMCQSEGDVILFSLPARENIDVVEKLSFSQLRGILRGGLPVLKSLLSQFVSNDNREHSRVSSKND